MTARADEGVVMSTLEVLSKFPRKCSICPLPPFGDARDKMCLCFAADVVQAEVGEAEAAQLAAAQASPAPVEVVSPAEPVVASPSPAEPSLTSPPAEPDKATVAAVASPGL